MSDTDARISTLVNDNDVVLFMKGTPLFPQCGFSSRAVAILDHCGISYESVDVLQDMEIRQGIKTYSDWPTIPQLYVKGEFVGGCDIIREMFQSGELQAHREGSIPGSLMLASDGLEDLVDPDAGLGRDLDGAGGVDPDHILDLLLHPLRFSRRQGTASEESCLHLCPHR